MRYLIRFLIVFLIVCNIVLACQPKSVETPVESDDCDNSCHWGGGNPHPGDL